MIALAPGRLPMGEAALPSPFPPFDLYCKLQSAIKCLHHGTKANNDPRLRGAWCIRAGRSDEGRVLDAARIEKVEAELSAFIDRRATQRDEANAEEMMWKASVKKHNDKLRTERLWDRLDYHRSQLESHTATFERLIRRHKSGLRLVEEELGIAGDEGAA